MHKESNSSGAIKNTKYKYINKNKWVDVSGKEKRKNGNCRKKEKTEKENYIHFGQSGH